MPITFNKIGVQSVTGEFIESVEVTKNMDSKMIMSTEGGFGAAKNFDPKYQVTVKGRGSVNFEPGIQFPTQYLPDYISASGVKVLTSVKISQKNDDFNEFEISGEIYPDASPVQQG